MKTFKYILAATAVVVVFGAAATAQQPMQGQGMMDHGEMQKMMDGMMPQSSDSPATKAFKEAHMKMMKAMHLTYTSNPDVDFVRSMIPHHQGAIEMAKVIQQYGKDTQTKKWASEIISAQEREMAEMEAWLKKNEK